MYVCIYLSRHLQPLCHGVAKAVVIAIVVGTDQLTYLCCGGVCIMVAGQNDGCTS